MELKGPGVYLIFTDDLQHFYIGSSGRSVKNRIQAHISTLRTGKHHNFKMQQLFDSGEAFNYTLICKADASNYVKKEQWCIDNFKPDLNICPIAESTLGKRHTEATKKKLRDSKLGAKNPSFGKRQSKEQIEARIKRGSAHWAYGKKFNKKRENQKAREHFFKKVELYYKDNTPFATFLSRNAAIEYITGDCKKRGGVYRALKSGGSAYGYFWRYLDERKVRS